jgi:hypothetical protein
MEEPGGLLFGDLTVTPTKERDKPPGSPISIDDRFVRRWPTFSGRLRTEAVSGANVQKRSRVADRPAVAKRARQLKPRLGERLALAGAVSLALFAWGLREIRQAL